MHVYGSARCYTDHILKSLVALTLSTTSHICVYMYTHVDIHEGDDSLMAVEVRCQGCLVPDSITYWRDPHHILYVKFKSEVRVRLTTAIVDEHNRCNTVSHVRKHANHWSSARIMPLEQYYPNRTFKPTRQIQRFIQHSIASGSVFRNIFRQQRDARSKDTMRHSSSQPLRKPSLP
jgi:hypothetical protein